jgi:ABC-2 type transport system permease protein
MTDRADNPFDLPPAPAFSPGRIGAMVLRHVYVLRGSLPRILELAYWPVMQMVVWGFLTRFLTDHSSWIAQAGGVLIGGVLLWDVLFRGQVGFSVSFLEEMWSRNLGHLFVSPLRPYELVLAMMLMSLIRTVIGLAPAWVLAYVFYAFSIFSLGPELVVFFASLMLMSWGIGLAVIALLLRYGLGAENLAWMTVFGLAPISAVYYPVATLPDWLQWVAWCNPAAYVFEGMRAVLVDHSFRPDLLIASLLVNVVYIAVGAGLFALAFAHARRRGMLLQMGE